MQAVRPQVEHYRRYGEALSQVSPVYVEACPDARDGSFPPSERPGRGNLPSERVQVPGMPSLSDGATPGAGMDEHVPGGFHPLRELRARLARAVQYVRSLSDVGPKG